jgi:hypothetical protein
MRVVVLTSVLTVLSGCTSFGPYRVAPDRFNYNEAIAASANEQMLLDLVRLRYQDVPVFLVVSSVLTQYVYSCNAGITCCRRYRCRRSRRFSGIIGKSALHRTAHHHLQPPHRR